MSITVQPWDTALGANSPENSAPAEKKAISDRATVGYYYWRDAKQMFRNIDQMIEANDRVNNEFYTCPVYNYTIKEGANVCAFDVVSMQGIGTPEDLESYINEN